MSSSRTTILMISLSGLGDHESGRCFLECPVLILILDDGDDESVEDSGGCSLLLISTRSFLVKGKIWRGGGGGGGGGNGGGSGTTPEAEDDVEHLTVAFGGGGGGGGSFGRLGLNIRVDDDSALDASKLLTGLKLLMSVLLLLLLIVLVLVAGSVVSSTGISAKICRESTRLGRVLSLMVSLKRWL